MSVDDERFKEKFKNRKYQPTAVPKNKVKIDDAFKLALKNKHFRLDSAVDKHGRPSFYDRSLKKLYDLSSSDSESEEDEQDSTVSVLSKESSGSENEQDSTVSVVDKETEAVQINDRDIDYKAVEKLPIELRRKLKDMKVDYARGEALLFSSSSSDDETEEETEVCEEDGFEHCWGELDQDAERTNEITHRLAVCNMDWDRIKAVDLMVALNSFVPASGHIRSIAIYPSEFGMKRQQEEEQHGPQELVENEDDEGRKYHMERLRQYQLNRLKYFYGVVDCDSKNTAEKLYTECDGIEYESSASKFDLRFISDDLTFDHAPREVCNKLPEPGKYKPKYFTTTALQQAKVELTWDETDPERVGLVQKLGKLEDVDEQDLRAFLASSSGEESDVSEEKVDESDNELEKHDKSSVIDKYKALLLDLDSGNVDEKEDQNNDIDMELVWDTGLQSKTEELIKEKKSEKKTPFQKYLEKRREKRKQKREQKKQKEDNQAESDDDIPSDIDMSNPYFAEEFNKPEFKSKKTKSNDKIVAEEDDTLDTDDVNQLELICSEKDERKHWHLNDILTNKHSKKKKKKERMHKECDIETDDFQCNVNDSRFSEAIGDSEYHLDRNEPNYIDTAGSQVLAQVLKKKSPKHKLKEKPDAVEDSRNNQLPSFQHEINIFHKNKKRKVAN